MTAIVEPRAGEKPSGLDPSQTMLGRRPHESTALSKTAAALSEEIAKMLRRTESPSRQGLPDHALGGALDERLYDALAAAKIMVSRVSMHLDREWREAFFRKLDELLDSNEWHEEDEILTAGSLETFLRFHLYLRPARPPSFGISNAGNLLAGWVNDRNRLTMEFLPADVVRWVLVRYFDGERETAAGQVGLLRIANVLAPFQLRDWFGNDG